MICLLRKNPHSQQPSAVGWSQLVASARKPASTRLAALSPLYEEHRQSKKRHVSNMMQAYTIVGSQRWLLVWRDALRCCSFSTIVAQLQPALHCIMQVLAEGHNHPQVVLTGPSQTYGL